MSASSFGDASAPDPSAPPPPRPSWEAAPQTARRPAPLPAARPMPYPAPAAPSVPQTAPTPYAAPPQAAPPQPSLDAAPVNYDLAGNALPSAAPTPSPYAQPTPFPAQGTAWPPAPLPRSGGPADVAYYSAASDRIPPEKMLMGIALGLAIGIVGGVIIEKILFYAHFGLSLLYVGMGYGIGWGIHRATGRGGAGLGMLAVGLMVVCLGISHLVWAQDILNAVRDAGNASPGATLFDALPIAMSSLGIMHWVCITFGLLACYRGVEAQQG